MATEYISTETGCQYLRKYKIEDGTSFLYDEGFNDGIETAISCIGNEVPAVDVRPVVRGKWKETVKRIIFATPCACCSACGESIVLGQLSFSDFSEMMRFCPLCGADMREVKTDD